MPLKRSLNAHEQVNYLRDEKNVAFEIIDEVSAERFLRERNYFFKLKAFAKNFDKRFAEGDGKGKYINLDFGHLVELSRLDKQLRDLVLQLTLDIEHCLKTRINKAAMQADIDPYELKEKYLAQVNSNVVNEQSAKIEPEEARHSLRAIKEHIERALLVADPIAIAQEMNNAALLLDEARLQRDPCFIEKSVSRMKDSPYSKNLIRKYENAPMPYWCFMELVSFGTTIPFYSTCFRKGGFLSSDEEESALLRRTRNMLRRAQSLRNAAAHNDCLLNGLAEHCRSRSSSGVKRMAQKEYQLDAGIFGPVSNVTVAIDVAAVLMCYCEFVPHGETRKAISDRLLAASSRFAKNSEWFSKTAPVYDFLHYAEYAFSHFSTILRKGCE